MVYIVSELSLYNQPGAEKLTNNAKEAARTCYTFTKQTKSMLTKIAHQSCAICSVTQDIQKQPNTNKDTNCHTHSHQRTNFQEQCLKKLSKCKQFEL